MMIMIANVLDADNLQWLRDNMRKTRYVDGRQTAGREARPVKRNEQVDRGDPLLAEMQDLVVDRLIENALFRMATRPHVVRPPLFSRYDAGMAYGSHVDDAIMGGMRTDVSVTTGDRVRRRRTGRQAARGLGGLLSDDLAAPRGASRVGRAACRGDLGPEPRSGRRCAGTAVRSRNRPTRAV